jgi:hypothetical protein
MANKPRKVGLDELTPEQRAQVEAVRTRFRTPTRRTEEEQVRARFKDRPTLDELIAKGDIDPDRIMTGGPSSRCSTRWPGSSKNAKPAG